MSLEAGHKLGHYDILALIGVGGMGEVYRATDTKLGRDVAIKILPAAVARDPERMARFEREAKVLAALNHPNIAAIYGLEEMATSGRAIVMELVEGPTLAERIGSGPIPLEESLKIAAQIADALEAAHDKGIVHRDLKPANVKAPHEGIVKVLDLGLATALPGGDREASDIANSPTLTMGATNAGVILGTASYMSPEQASGRRVDKRADIWSFGVVLWEMLTGHRMFDGGETVSHTLADVLRAPIHFERLPPATPAPIRDLLKRCLDRDVKTRLRDIGEARIAINKWLANPVEPIAAEASPVRKGGGALPWIAATAVAVVIVAMLAFLHFRETTPPEHTLRYTIPLPEGSFIHSFAVSPDGQTVVLAAQVSGKRQLWLRSLDALKFQPMPSTEDAIYPFWSPDSRYIGFFALGKLRKIAASGGPSQALCDASDGRGGSWNRDDVIVFSPSFGDNVIRRVSAAGGTPSDVTKIKVASQYPSFLPDGRRFLYYVTATAEMNGIYVSSLDGAENRRLLADNSDFAFAPPAPGSRIGYVLFLRENNLMAQPVDAGAAQLAGEGFPVAEGIPGAQNASLPVSASNNGVLVYWNGGGGFGGQTQIVFYDRGGKAENVGTPGNILVPALSPDEKTIVFSRGTGGARDIWLWDLVRRNEQKLTKDAVTNFSPFFSPNGDRIVYRSDRGGHRGDLWVRAANGSGQDELLLSTPNQKIVNQWSRDGRFIVYMEQDPKTKWDLWYLPLDQAGDAKQRKGMPFLHSEVNELYGQLSPNSRWMAYTSDVSGKREVYVQPFPSADHEITISTAGGEQPRWSRDGKELFYLSADGKLTVVAVRETAGPKPSFHAGTPVALFDAHLATTNAAFNYDVSADGKRFLMVTTASAGSSTVPGPLPLTVRVNWLAGVKK